MIKACRPKLEEKLKFFISFHSNTYSYTHLKDELVATHTLDDQEYKLTLKYSKVIDDTDPEMFTFHAIFFKSMMRMMEFEQLGRNCFNPKKAVTIQGLEVWPGFYSAMNNLEGGPLMQIDLTSKVCRKDCVLNHLKDLERKNYDKERINEECKFMTVVTSYSKAGKHTYKVERIDFEKTPSDTFTKKDGTEISFGEYYKQQYQLDIRDRNQPLLVSKNERTGNEIYLIPELCEMTGLTDKHRADFRLMKELSGVLHKSARVRH